MRFTTCAINKRQVNLRELSLKVSKMDSERFQKIYHFNKFSELSLT